MPKKPSDSSPRTDRAITKRKGARADARKAPRDVALLAGPTEDGQGAQVLRVKDGQVTAGELRPAREGQPLHEGGELVRLQPMHPQLPVCEVETLYTSKESGAPDGPAARSHGGPARVSNDSYRKNWSAVFGGKRARKPRKGDGPDYSVN